jgi:uncharacterized membrane protein
MESMRTSAFLRRLRAELPVWVQQGWVAPRHQQAILEHVGHQARNSSRYLTVALSIMGALLLGAGALSFFAANWYWIPKAVKLAALFGALGACYGMAHLCFTRALGALGHGLLLLGVALFGASIFLIAQIYRIDLHYPDGLLWWALGAFATAVLVPSPLVLVAALGLMLLWSGMEMFVFGRNPHAWFLLPWAAGLLPIYFYRWRAVLGVAGGALLVWCLMGLLVPRFLERPWIAGERMALLQIYMFAGIALYIVARAMAWYARWSPFAAPLVTVGAVFAVTALYLLGFPAIHRFDAPASFSAPLPAVWISATTGMLLLVAALMVWRYKNTQLSSLPRYRQAAFGWLVLAAVLALVNLLVSAYPGWMALGYNVLGLAGVVWLVFTGVDRGERHIINLGFAFFGALLLARYYDTFWTLLDRSYFFMAGGALLLAAGYFLERSRRRFTARAGGAA